MKVGNLRDCNITLHLNLNSKREIVPDIAAVYLIEPKEENFKRVAEDATNNIYDFFFITFTRQISPEALS